MRGSVQGLTAPLEWKRKLDFIGDHITKVGFTSEFHPDLISKVSHREFLGTMEE